MTVHHTFRCSACNTDFTNDLTRENAGKFVGVVIVKLPNGQLGSGEALACPACGELFDHPLVINPSQSKQS